MKKVLLVLGLLLFFCSACVLLEEFPIIVIVTETSTSQSTAVTRTPTIIPSSTVGTTPTKTATIMPTATKTPSPSPTPQPSATPTAVPYQLQSGSPAYTANFGYPEAGCNWLGVGGQIFNENGNPIINLVVWIRGKINGTPFESVVLTGTAEGDKYGPGGYEAVINNTVLESSGVFSIQILDLSGNVLTDPISFDTHANCDQNLILINFTKK